MKFSIMDLTGHSEECYNETEVAAAMVRFAKLTAEGFTAATRKAGEREYSVVRAFDPAASETLFVPPLQGG